MQNVEQINSLFQEAVAAIDAGDVGTLRHLLTEHPTLVDERLESPGPWLRDKVGGALDGFFARPYLLWFVAEDPVRNKTLPPNIVDVARVIIDAAKRQAAPTLQKQLDYALTLVVWSWIAAQSGVQIALIDLLLDAGASPEGAPNNALVNGHIDAAEHLVKRGAPLTLAAALCIGRWDDVTRLASTVDGRKKRFAFVASALNGQANALRRMIELGAKVNAPSEDLYSHGTPLHHAVCSGRLEAVTVLVEAGADLKIQDTAWKATPREWAKRYIQETKGDKQYPQIAAYLAEAEARAGYLAVHEKPVPLPSSNKQTVEKYMDGFNKSDHAQILSCLTDDVEWVLPGAFHLIGKEAFDKEIENPAFISPPKVTVDRMTEEGDVVVAEGSVHTVRRDGEKLHLAFCDVFEMRGGKIRKLISYLAELKG